ncbi:Hypothetical predicted protein [Podarcis lilfordi]|uniref:Uncharacterized protein n=1 Tax=Podarcis lilfordi TaxID=74358 RepID=A0AA35LEQ4_9SAUR|nr:Hypothetical predicted protein [Podarcis lilfordi]
MGSPRRSFSSPRKCQLTAAAAPGMPGGCRSRCSPNYISRQPLARPRGLPGPASRAPSPLPSPAQPLSITAGLARTLQRDGAGRGRTPPALIGWARLPIGGRRRLGGRRGRQLIRGSGSRLCAWWARLATAQQFFSGMLYVSPLATKAAS